jgi:isopenicillin N synthase-like dioxygenase
MYVAKVDFRDTNAPKIFTDSLRDTGFGVITHHPLDMALVNAVYDEWKAFFANEEKHNYLFKRETQDGYFPMTVSEKAKGFSELDIKEYYHYYPWGRYPDGMSNKTRELAEAMTALATTLLNWIEQYTPADISAQLSQPLSQMIKDSPNTLFRILHYPPLTGEETAGAIRAAAHEDINLITLLPAATSAGLQVKDTKGQWHDVPCDPGSVVINTGDMLQECTQGYYKATTHQVVNPSDAIKNESRLSMPLFLHPRDEVVLSKRHTHRSYLNERLKELGVL